MVKPIEIVQTPEVIFGKKKNCSNLNGTLDLKLYNPSSCLWNVLLTPPYPPPPLLIKNMLLSLSFYRA